MQLKLGRFRFSHHTLWWAGARPQASGSPSGQALDFLVTRSTTRQGPDGINLYLSRFELGAKTPVHDHSTWGVVHVLEGRDRHVRWERVDDGAGAEHTSLRSVDERIVGAGQSVHWFPPPGDIHSQEALDVVVWELVVTGCDLTHATDGDHRHWFDLKTGNDSHRPPK